MTDNLPALLKACQAKGTDSQFRAWIQRQPSCVSGRFSEHLESGEGRSAACHIRRAESSDTAFKPAYFAVPTTHAEHHRPHAYGDARLLHEAGLIAKPERELAAGWFDAKGEEYLRLWLAS